MLMLYMNNKYTRDLVKKIGTMTVLFRDGRKATFTKNVLESMLRDDFVVEIMDDKTGEMLKG